jgi:3-deoxy-D-manno-octulosonic-acid transferase
LISSHLCLEIVRGFRYIQKIVYFLYSVVFALALAAVLPMYLVRLRIRRGEPLHLKERLGIVLPATKGGRPFLWIHAVSVGEVLSLQNLIRAVRAAHPDWEIGFSVLTNTGYSVAREKIKDIDHLFFVPLDIGWSVRRVFARLRPDLLVLAESEYWPRLLREAERRDCPVLVVNGRISARTFHRMRRIGRPAGRLLGKVSRFLVQTPRDRDRLEGLGVPASRIEVAGNLKCEISLAAPTQAELDSFKSGLGIPSGSKVVVAGSVHVGEEGPLLDAFRNARRKRSDVRFVLAPRHPDKFGDLKDRRPDDGLVIRRRTTMESGQDWDILILDTIGELARVYAACDAAFIGGSLIPWGGQNLLEPAFYGKPIVFGPHMENFAALAEAFVEGGGARIVRTDEELSTFFAFEKPAEMEDMGRRARSLLLSLQGATDRVLAAMKAMMGRSHD